MKATLGTTYRGLQSQLNQMSTRLEDLRNMAASGKKLTRASDDPAAIRPVLSARAQIRATDRYLSTTGMALDKMQALDGHLDHVENVMVKVKELALAGLNDSNSAADRETLADQVAAMRSELLDTANAQLDGKYIFAGFKETTKPFTVSSGLLVYQGDANATELEISPGESVQVSLTGSKLFLGMEDTNDDGQPDTQVGTDIFATLDTVESALRNNDSTTLNDQLEPLEEGADQVRAQRSLIGNNANRVETARGHLESTRNDTIQILSRYEDADIIETMTNLTQQQTAFQAALQVTAQVSKLSILNYL